MRTLMNQRTWRAAGWAVLVIFLTLPAASAGELAVPATPATDAGAVTLLRDGDYLPALLTAIGQARAEIVLSAFFFRTGRMAEGLPDRVMAALGAAAGRGVQVTAILERGPEGDNVSRDNAATAVRLQGAGIRIGNVLQDPLLAMPTVVLVAVWKSFGFYMVIFLAGLQDIPGNLYEAAQLDGANAWKRFTNVTYPMLSNTLAFVVIVALIAAFQAFDQIYVLTGGGPYRSTETIVMQVYQSGFKDLDLGFASALSYVLLIITLLLSLVQFLFFGRRGEEIAK